MDVIKEVVVYLGVLCHTAQQLVDQLAHPETHRVATGFVRLGSQSVQSVWEKKWGKRGARRRIGEKQEEEWTERGFAYHRSEETDGVQQEERGDRWDRTKIRLRGSRDINDIRGYEQKLTTKSERFSFSM